MRDLMAELKELRLHGMATAWAELTAQGESNTASSKWLLEHLLEHLPLLLLQLSGIVPTPQHQHEVVAVAQHR